MARRRVGMVCGEGGVEGYSWRRDCRRLCVRISQIGVRFWFLGAGVRFGSRSGVPVVALFFAWFTLEMKSVENAMGERRDEEASRGDEDDSSVERVQAGEDL